MTNFHTFSGKCSATGSDAELKLDGFELKMVKSVYINIEAGNKLVEVTITLYADVDSLTLTELSLTSKVLENED